MRRLSPRAPALAPPLAAPRAAALLHLLLCLAGSWLGARPASGAALEADVPALAPSALLERWAPSFAQEISADHPERDRALPFDFDGDWNATNNWTALTPRFEHARPVVYGAAILTHTHAYLFYTLFFPRDWFSPVCVDYLCHDNDLEVALAVVQRATEPEQERLLFVETKAHRDYVAVRAEDLARDAGGRPWIRVESEGHGMYPLRRREAFPAAAQRLVPGAYRLASLYDTLWARRAPHSAQGALWTSGETGFLAYAGGRFGRRGALLGVALAGREYAGGVRPAWGLRAPGSERGDWFLDPAQVAGSNHREWLGPEPPSLEYAFNPFLDDLTRECVGAACPAIVPPPAPSGARFGLATGLALATGLVSFHARRRLLARCRRVVRRWRGH